MGKKLSNLMMITSLAMMSSVSMSTCFNTFDSYNPPSMNNSKKHKAKIKKAKAKRNKKR